MQFTSTAREDVNRSVGYPANFAVPLRQVDTVRPEDPEPWVAYAYDDSEFRHAGNWYGDYEWAPRPGYRAPQNPILEAYRNLIALGTLDEPMLASARRGLLLNQWYLPEHVEHARKVLTRLANLTKED